MRVVDNRVDGVLAVARAFGDCAFKLKPILGAAGQAVTCMPDFVELDRTSDDEYIIIACDGIWDCKSNEEATAYMDDKFKTNGIK